MATETKFTLTEVELMVKEAGEYAYHQGKLETEQRIINFLDSMLLHPAKPSLDLIIERLRGGLND
jgi:hypothetical protein